MCTWTFGCHNVHPALSSPGKSPVQLWEGKKPNLICKHGVQVWGWFTTASVLSNTAVFLPRPCANPGRVGNANRPRLNNNGEADLSPRQQPKYPTLYRTEKQGGPLLMYMIDWSGPLPMLLARRLSAAICPFMAYVQEVTVKLIHSTHTDPWLTKQRLRHSF